jgi:hypothetical protein
LRPCWRVHACVIRRKHAKSLIGLSRVNDTQSGARATVLRIVRAIDYDNVTRSERPRVRSTNRRA